MHAVADLGVRVGDVLRVQATVDRLPDLAGVVGAEGARGRDGDVHPTRVRRIEQDRVEAHPAGARLPFGSGAVAAQTGELLPRRAAVARAKQGGVLRSEEHTSELQSRSDLVCRLLLEKKKK